jgi:predicted transcriptional regulator
MTGKNWNSKKEIFEDIKSEVTINKAKYAVDLKEKGIPVAEIAEKMELSKARIYEYLRK